MLALTMKPNFLTILDTLWNFKGKAFIAFLTP